eukprot:283396-Chlamydomonas_euryale.AAC.5
MADEPALPLSSSCLASLRAQCSPQPCCCLNPSKIFSRVCESDRIRPHTRVTKASMLRARG